MSVIDLWERVSNQFEDIVLSINEMKPDKLKLNLLFKEIEENKLLFEPTNEIISLERELLSSVYSYGEVKDEYFLPAVIMDVYEIVSNIQNINKPFEIRKALFFLFVFNALSKTLIDLNLPDSDLLENGTYLENGKFKKNILILKYVIEKI